MKRTTFKVLFFIKKSKLLKNGNAPVYMRITVNGMSAESSLNRSLEPKLWDTKRNLAKGKKSQSIELNDYLSCIKSQIYLHYRDLQENGQDITAKTLRNAFLGVEENPCNLIQVFEEHNSQVALLVGTDYSKSTLDKFGTTVKHLQSYCLLSFQKEDVNIKLVNHKFLKGFETYLKVVVRCQHNSAMKHLKALKKVVRIALADDLIRIDPFIRYKITQKRVLRDYLTNEEITCLMDKDIDIQRLDVIRDVFVFQCFTGLSFGDVAKLSRNNLQIGIDGEQWLYVKRNKTGVPCRLPILPIAKTLINKYENSSFINADDKLFPVPSNQKMNAYLKEIAIICGIKKNLHTHVARHTYATTITLGNGLPMETVSKLLGHTKLQTTQIYAKIIDDKLSDDVNKLRRKFNY